MNNIETILQEMEKKIPKYTRMETEEIIRTSLDTQRLYNEMAFHLSTDEKLALQRLAIESDSYHIAFAANLDVHKQLDWKVDSPHRLTLNDAYQTLIKSGLELEKDKHDIYKVNAIKDSLTEIVRMYWGVPRDEYREDFNWAIQQSLRLLKKYVERYATARH